MFHLIYFTLQYATYPFLHFHKSKIENHCYKRDMWWSSITLFSKPTIFISFKSTIVCGISNQDRKQIQEYTINVAITQTVPTNMKNLLGKIHRSSCSKFLQKIVRWQKHFVSPFQTLTTFILKPMTYTSHPDFNFEFPLLFHNIFSEGFPIVKYPVKPTSFPYFIPLLHIN